MALQGATALLPPGAPQQEAQQIENKHGGLGEGAEERFVVVLPLEDVLERRSAEKRSGWYVLVYWYCSGFQSVFKLKLVTVVSSDEATQMTSTSNRITTPRAMRRRWAAALP